MSALADRFDQQMHLCGVTGYVYEHRFDKARRWRVDFAFVNERLAVEVEGGIWSGGRHTYPGGYRGDMAKYNELARQGWTLLRVTTDMVRSGEAVRLVEEVLAEIRLRLGQQPETPATEGASMRTVGAGNAEQPASRVRRHRRA